MTPLIPTPPPATPNAGQPMASVLMVTYNHAAYVARAIESVLAQRTTFPFEFLIGEDCSTDGTRELVADYAARHPGRIRPLLHERNLGGTGRDRNFVRTLAACTGKYVAWLDGDDYWTHPDKLQRQVDYLEARPDHVQCFHAVRVVHEDGSVPTRVDRPTRPYAAAEDHIYANLMLPCSVVFRRGLWPRLPDWYFPLRTGDWPLFVLNAMRGRTGYLDEEMAVYRVHQGWWQGLDRVSKQLHALETYEAMAAHLGHRYRPAVDAGMAHCCCKLAMAYERAGDLAAAARYARVGLRRAPCGPWRQVVQLARVLLRAAAPGPYQAARRARRLFRGRDGAWPPRIHHPPEADR
jgi:glycosyltransferase involved in cell wall biosynthesis